MTTPLQIGFTKLSQTRHRLTITRPDGRTESVELESRSMLLHDFAHYAVEAEAALEDGVWGLLARGTSLAQMSDTGHPVDTPGLRIAETLSAPLQTVFKRRMTPEAYLTYGREAHPGLVDRAFVAAVLERMRRLWGHYRKTGYRDTMQVPWPALPLTRGAGGTTSGG